MRRFVAAFLILSIIFIKEIDFLHASGQENIDCVGRCDYRCSKASREKICFRSCNTCCRRCGCVPPGTSGNTDICPCYANMTTHGGRLKCP